MLLAKNDIEDVHLELLSKGVKIELGVARRNGALGAMRSLYIYGKNLIRRQLGPTKRPAKQTNHLALAASWRGHDV